MFYCICVTGVGESMKKNLPVVAHFHGYSFSYSSQKHISLQYFSKDYYFKFRLFYNSPFLPHTARRNPNISHLFQCAINRRVAVSLFWFYSVTSKFSFLVWSTHYKPFLTQNRFCSLNTPISE